MHLRLVFGALLAGLITFGCTKKAAEPPSTLTERDAEPHDGGLQGDGWSLPLDPSWRRVKEEARLRFRPAAAAWAVAPQGPVQLTIACQATGWGCLASLKEQLEPRRAAGAIDLARVEEAKGAFLEGATATWTEARELHALGRFQVLSGRCDVHAWGPLQGGASLEALERAVSRFESTEPLLVRELLSLAELIDTHPRAKERATRVGYASLGDDLMRDALLRLPDERLAERFSLRLRLLNQLPSEQCAGLAKQRLDHSLTTLTRSSEAEAVAWVGLTRQAVLLSLDKSAPVRRPTLDEVTRAAAPMMEHDEPLQAALGVLHHPESVTPTELCEAERLRLTKVLAQAEPQRSVLLRSLLDDH